MTLHHFIKPAKKIKHLPGPADRIISKRGSSSVCFGHMNFMLLNICQTEDTKANNILHKLVCEEQHMHNEKVWNIKHGLVHQSFAAGPAAR
jgi:hypothetical protein